MTLKTVHPPYHFITLLFTVLIMSSCKQVHYVTASPTASTAKEECVVLFHGMARSHRSMEEMQEYLTDVGYHTVNVGYPSTKLDVQSISASYFAKAVATCEQFQPTVIHFVTHSLGGILTRYSLQQQPLKNLGRVVMLSPPNKGSEATDKLKDWLLYQWLNGPAGQQLETSKDSLPNRLGPATFSVGIITGNQHAFFDGWLADIIPGEDDGKVSIESAKLEGMLDFLVVEESHPFIMDSELVQQQTQYFLENGVFEKRPQ